MSTSVDKEVKNFCYYPTALYVIFLKVCGSTLNLPSNKTHLIPYLNYLIYGKDDNEMLFVYKF